jgi:peptide-methionine (S)-S-oxide reductase
VNRTIRGLLLGLGLLMTSMVPGSAQAQSEPQQATAIFGGGCFWCVEADFDKVPGVLSTTSGYIGGNVPNPTYQQVSAGGTGHAEVVRVVYDPSKVSYRDLLAFFWRNIDPLTVNAQFCDRGSQYRSAVFYLDDEQKRLAEASKAEMAQHFKPRPIVTEIAPATEFYPAEDYHQDYYQKNELKYKFYRWSCGRDARLEEVWGAEAGGRKSS